MARATTRSGPSSSLRLLCRGSTAIVAFLGMSLYRRVQNVVRRLIAAIAGIASRAGASFPPGANSATSIPVPRTASAPMSRWICRSPEFSRGFTCANGNWAGRCAALEMAENKEPDRRRQVALVAVVVDLVRQVRQRHFSDSGNFLHAIPEVLFQTHAGLVAGNDDRPFCDM
jgi:hypothetical protein